MMATTRAAITEPTIHLFLVILLNIEVRTFLLLSIASSTPWSWNGIKTTQNSLNKLITSVVLVNTLDQWVINQYHKKYCPFQGEKD